MDDTQAEWFIQMNEKGKQQYQLMKNLLLKKHMKVSELTKEVEQLRNIIQSKDKQIANLKTNRRVKDNTCKKLETSVSEKETMTVQNYTAQEDLPVKKQTVERDNRNQATLTASFEKMEQSLNQQISAMKDDFINLINERLCTKPSEFESYAGRAKGKYSKQYNEVKANANSQQEKQKFISQRTILEQLEEEIEQKERELNIIIHGKSETLIQNEDTKFVHKLVEAVAGNIKPKSFERFGIIKENKKRPIKVIFHNVEHKAKVMNNLRDLKGRQEFKGISITDDHTWNEREQIKKFMKDAKEQNLKEPETSYYVWKVRGTLKTVGKKK